MLINNPRVLIIIIPRIEMKKDDTCGRGKFFFQPFFRVMKILKYSNFPGTLSLLFISM